MNRKLIIGALSLSLLAGAAITTSCGKDDVPEKPVWKPNTSTNGGSTTTDGGSTTGGGTGGATTGDGSEWPVVTRNPYKEGTFRGAINYENHPIFRLACGIENREFLDNNNPAAKIVFEHFDEITFGNELKFASCIKSGSTTGETDFTIVKNMIKQAKAHNIGIFGHTLAWHSQQPVAYLRPLVKSGTQEEKKARMEEAMEKWIDACMKETGGYITCWDAVNEAISDKDNDNDGYYDLQGYGNSASNNLNLEGDNFYWQDYLGPEDYIPFVFNTAREKFEDYYGEKVSQLKLFINDFNLESDWDGNLKLKSLLNWIKIWEKKGCKIDGIGTQMHIHCYAKTETHESKKKAITEMFRLMASSGKLCKISELDLGFKRLGNEAWDAPSVQYDELTDEEAEVIADMYEFVVKEYFRLIPPAQQFGITQWCLADSPKNSGWRKGEPAGFWKMGFKETWPMYDGFMRGLEAGGK